MLGQLKIRTIAPVILGGLLGVAVIAGCNKAKPIAATNPPGPTSAPIAAGPAAPATSGRAIFEAKCMNCHTAGVPSAGPAGGGKGMRGPDLAKVGANPMHTRDWIMAYVRNPKELKPDARMRAFGNQIPDVDLASLADYLLSLKGS